MIRLNGASNRAFKYFFFFSWKSLDNSEQVSLSFFSILRSHNYTASSQYSRKRKKSFRLRKIWIFMPKNTCSWSEIFLSLLLPNLDQIIFENFSLLVFRNENFSTIARKKKLFFVWRMGHHMKRFSFFDFYVKVEWRRKPDQAGYVRSWIVKGKLFLPEQYRSWQWMESSLDQAMNRERCRSNRSRQHGRWWYLELKRWSHGTNQRHHLFSMSSWYSQPSHCIDDLLYPCRHQHPNEYERNPMGRRSREM